MIRTATRDDLDAVQQLYKQWIAEDITWYVSIPDLEEKLGDGFLVYEERDRVIAFLVSERRTSGHFFTGGPADFVQLQDLYVAPGSRGAGIGGRLVRRLLEECRRHGIVHFTVHSANKDLLRIHRFYERLGFKPNWLEMYQ